MRAQFFAAVALLLAAPVLAACTTASTLQTTKTAAFASTNAESVTDVSGEPVEGAEDFVLASYAGSTPEDRPADLAPVVSAPAVASTPRERECLMRAMYFESIRSSQDGLLSVGTVVMNRVASPKYPNTVCAVVGQKNQFAPGVLTRKMQGDTTDLARLADEILAGKRHPKASPKVMFFHTAGLKFPYQNMRYTHVAGGNSFYYKASRS